MTFDEAVALTRAHIERQFPRSCTACGRLYPTLRAYLSETRHVGLPTSYDAELRSQTGEPIGTLSLANCACGGTMGIGSEGMALFTYWRLMAWGFAETRRQRISFSELLAQVRAAIDQQVLSEPDAQLGHRLE